MAPSPRRGGARVLVAGGGIAAAEAALALRAAAGSRADITLLAPNRELGLPPLHPLWAVRGAPEPVALPRVAAAAGAALVRGRLMRVDHGRRTAVADTGAAIGYDRLVVAVGAVREPSVTGALPLGAPGDAPAVRRLLERLRDGAARGVGTRLAIVVPGGPGWPLPAYELALLIARRATSEGVRAAVDLSVVTSEPAPLAALGPVASDAVAADLAAAGVALHAGAVVREWAFGRLRTIPPAAVPADRVVALAAVRGPRVPGLPADALGFVRADPEGRVDGVEGVDVVGDAGPFPVKHGGIAARQADAVASRLAAELGAPVAPEAIDPLLVARVLGGECTRGLSARVTGGRTLAEGATWPEAPGAGRTLAARHLAPLLDRIGAAAGA